MNGDFEWAAPDEEVFAFVNDFERPIGTYLYGRRMYEAMVYCETVSTSGDQPAVSRVAGAAADGLSPAAARRRRPRRHLHDQHRG